MGVWSMQAGRQKNHLFAFGVVTNEGLEDKHLHHIVVSNFAPLKIVKLIFRNLFRRDQNSWIC